MTWMLTGRCVVVIIIPLCFENKLTVRQMQEGIWINNTNDRMIAEGILKTFGGCGRMELAAGEVIAVSF